MEKNENITQLLCLDSRKKLTLDNVKNVELLTQKEVFLETGLGGVRLLGCDMRLSEFCMEDSRVVIEGRIDSVCYTSFKGKKSFIKGLLR